VAEEDWQSPAGRKEVDWLLAGIGIVLLVVFIFAFGVFHH
jgi:hypothetical protein